MKRRNTEDKIIEEKKRRRESGVPGGGAGRKDEDVGGSGVYPATGPEAPADAILVAPAAWGQGARGAAGYDDHGDSEISIPDVRPEKCRDLMTKNPVCCLRTETVSEAAGRMKKYGVGALPVVDNQRDKHMAGIVTDRDLALEVLAEKRGTDDLKVAEIMTPNPVSCSPDDDCARAVELMEEHQIRRIPAVDTIGRVVGIISQSDIAVRMHDSVMTAELLVEVSRPSREMRI